MNGAPLVSVVVLNWNGRHLMQTCLDALLDQVYPEVEVIVVDNASTDGSCPFLRERYGSRFQIVELEENAGYAGGNNAGFAVASGEFLVTLNNDTRVAPGWIQALVDAASRSDRIGICASRQMKMDDPDVIDSVGIGIHRNAQSRSIGNRERYQGQYGSPMEVFGAHGASAFYRRRALEEAGGLDEDFFAYEEEFDLCWRMRLLGWRCLYVPGAVLEHQVGATVRKRPGLHEYLSARNRILCILKNYPRGVLLESIPELARCELWNLYLGLFRSETFRVHGRLGVLPLLGKMMNRRREIQSRRRMTDDEFRSWLGVEMRPPDGIV